ncbi:hypothetical protein BKA61DRAFT_670620 [Leptodontidium sp. MPI-SDFR-AT-0119]|nr:hypothetical protein BKA61DRAFT_670620 [Leptodontidium sp. MPI-SDFR-AT-0119]
MSGLEVVGSIASVVQLAGTVYAISKTLYEVGETDHMMDALGVPNASLLDGQNDERVAEQTMWDMEETRRKLAGISMKQVPEPSVSETSSLTLQRS